MLLCVAQLLRLPAQRRLVVGHPLLRLALGLLQHGAALGQLGHDHLALVLLLALLLPFLVGAPALARLAGVQLDAAFLEVRLSLPQRRELQRGVASGLIHCPQPFGVLGRRAVQISLVALQRRQIRRDRGLRRPNHDGRGRPDVARAGWRWRAEAAARRVRGGASGRSSRGGAEAPGVLLGKQLPFTLGLLSEGVEALALQPGVLLDRKAHPTAGDQLFACTTCTQTNSAMDQKSGRKVFKGEKYDVDLDEARALVVYGRGGRTISLLTAPETVGASDARSRPSI